MKAFKYIFFLLLILIIGTSIYIATLKGDYDVKANLKMKVPAEMIFNNINDYKNWATWGPWHELDETIVASYPENTSGIGSSYTWTSKEGMGSIETISLEKNKELIQQIDFGTGSTPEIYWELNQVGDSTEVVWGMRGEKTFSEKAYWLVKGGIDKNLQPMYQRGLVLLEQEMLKEMDVHSTEFKGIVDHGGGYYLYQTVSCKNEKAEEEMQKMYPQIFEYMAKNNIEASGKIFTLNHQVDLENNTVMFSACVPIKERIITEGNILTGYLKPQKTFKTIFKGNYKFLATVWPTIYKQIADKELTPVLKGYSFEVYTINPNDTQNPAEWLTEIYVPLKDEETEKTTFNFQSIL